MVYNYLVPSLNLSFDRVLDRDRVTSRDLVYKSHTRITMQVSTYTQRKWFNIFFNRGRVLLNLNLKLETLSQIFDLDAKLDISHGHGAVICSFAYLLRFSARHVW